MLILCGNKCWIHQYLLNKLMLLQNFNHCQSHGRFREGQWFVNPLTCWNSTWNCLYVVFVVSFLLLFFNRKVALALAHASFCLCKQFHLFFLQAGYLPSLKNNCFSNQKPVYEIEKRCRRSQIHILLTADSLLSLSLHSARGMFCIGFSWKDSKEICSMFEQIWALSHRPHIQCE